MTTFDDELAKFLTIWEGFPGLKQHTSSPESAKALLDAAMSRIRENARIDKKVNTEMVLGPGFPTFTELTEFPDPTLKDWEEFTKTHPEYLRNRVEMYKHLLGNGQITAGKLAEFLSHFPKELPLQLADTSGWGDLEEHEIRATESTLYFNAG